MLIFGSLHRFFADPPVSGFSETFYNTSSLANRESLGEGHPPRSQPQVNVMCLQEAHAHLGYCVGGDPTRFNRMKTIAPAATNK